MAGETFTPNMNLPVPAVGTTTGPSYADDINDCMDVIDSHDHSSGYGVQITPAGININSDFDINNYNITEPRTVRFYPQTSTLIGGSDLCCIYSVGPELYYTDGNNNPVQITDNGSIAGATGTIGGLTSPASASYVAVSSTFIFQSNANVAASLDVRNVILRNSAASSYGLTLSPPASMGANYPITFPTLPSSQKIMTLDNLGNMAAPYTVDGSTITISSNVIGVPAGGITSTQLGTASVIAGKLGGGAVTTGTIATGAVTAATIATGAVTASALGSGSVTSAALGIGSVTSVAIAANSIATGAIQAGAVVSTNIGTNTIQTSNYQDQSVTATKMALNTITNSQLAANCVQSSNILAGNVGTTQLASTSVTQDKLQASSLGTSATLGNVMASADIILDNFTATTYTNIASGTIVTSGNRPVMCIMCCYPSGTGFPGNIEWGDLSQLGGNVNLELQVLRDTTPIGSYITAEGIASSNLGYHTSWSYSWIWVDVPPSAGTHTYYLQASITGDATGLYIDINYYRFIVYEL